MDKDKQKCSLIAHSQFDAIAFALYARYLCATNVKKSI